MQYPYRILLHMTLASGLLIAGLPLAMASVPGQIGPYRIQIATEPGVIPVGKARLTIDLTNAAGNPIEGARIRSLVQMPAMNMGEREALAQAVPGKPGRYTTDASFAMAGGYDAALAISGPLGEASGKIRLETGQDTEDRSSGTFTGSLLPWLGAALLAALAGFVLFRMRKTGQRVAWSSVINRGTVGGVVLLVIIYAASRYAIDHWRRPGAMTPIEAQGMEMNTTAPPGAAPVTLAEAVRAPIENTVWYAGQAVAFNEQDVTARTEGWLNWMPFYTGQKVKADEVVARLDISLLHAHLAESQAAVEKAAQGVTVSEHERLLARADVGRVRAELRSRNDAVEGAQAEIAAAEEERAVAEAELASRQSRIADAEAMIAAMEADRQYWQQQDARNKTLLDKGALSLEEYQRDAAATANAVAKVRQAQSRLTEAQAEVRSAQAAVRKAQALINGAEKKRQQMASEARTAEAAIGSAEAAVDLSSARIGEAQAGVAQARESLAVTTVTHGYSEIRAQIDGIVTQRLLGPGQLVSPGQAILRVAQTNPIRLQANVAEADLGRIKIGSRVVARGQSNTHGPVIATVTSIAPTVDPVTRTGIVEAVAPNPDGRFMPGQFAALDISTGSSQDALRVPIAAVHKRAQTSYIWVADAAGPNGQYTVKPVDVTTGVSDGVNVQIVSGLEPGQKVVVIGSENLKRGDTVFAGESEGGPR